MGYSISDHTHEISLWLGLGDHKRPYGSNKPLARAGRPQATLPPTNSFLELPKREKKRKILSENIFAKKGRTSHE